MILKSGCWKKSNKMQQNANYTFLRALSLGFILIMALNFVFIGMDCVESILKLILEELSKISTPGPWRMQFSTMGFPIMGFFKKYPRYWTHEDYSFTYVFYISVVLIPSLMLSKYSSSWFLWSRTRSQSVTCASSSTHALFLQSDHNF